MIPNFRFGDMYTDSIVNGYKDRTVVHPIPVTVLGYGIIMSWTLTAVFKARLYSPSPPPQHTLCCLCSKH